ncbi:MAG: hypothetical protein ACREQN_13740, partial [Candidatus Binataceae bacterium]
AWDRDIIKFDFGLHYDSFSQPSSQANGKLRNAGIHCKPRLASLRPNQPAIRYNLAKHDA